MQIIHYNFTGNDLALADRAEWTTFIEDVEERQVRKEQQ